MRSRHLETRCETHASGARVYTLCGDLFGSSEGYAFQDEVRLAVADGARGVVIDVRDVSRIDSCGVGILVAIMWSASAAKTRMILAALPQRVEEVLRLALLLDHIDRADSVDDALAKL